MEIAIIVLITSILLKVATLAILGIKVLPKMYDETKAANGLGWLRRSLLTIGIILFVTHLVGVLFLGVAFSDGIVRMPLNSMIVSINNSLGGFLVALILFLIYHKDRYANRH